MAWLRLPPYHSVHLLYGTHTTCLPRCDATGKHSDNCYDWCVWCRVLVGYIGPHARCCLVSMWMWMCVRVATARGAKPVREEKVLMCLCAYRFYVCVFVYVASTDDMQLVQGMCAHGDSVLDFTPLTWVLLCSELQLVPELLCVAFLPPSWDRERGTKHPSHGVRDCCWFTDGDYVYCGSGYSYMYSNNYVTRIKKTAFSSSEMPKNKVLSSWYGKAKVTGIYARTLDQVRAALAVWMRKCDSGGGVAHTLAWNRPWKTCPMRSSLRSPTTPPTSPAASGAAPRTFFCFCRR